MAAPLILTALLFLAAHAASYQAKLNPRRWQPVEKLLCFAAALALAGALWTASDHLAGNYTAPRAGAGALVFLVLYPLLLIRFLPRPHR